jgi:hypothetical protein
MEAAFGERVKYMATIDSVYKKARRIIKTLNHSGLPLYMMTQTALVIADTSAAVLSQLS